MGSSREIDDQHTTHDRQVEQATAVEEFLLDKLTNLELHAWMKGRIAGIFFQTHNLAYDQAKRAEKGAPLRARTGQHELYQFGYLDSMR